MKKIVVVLVLLMMCSSASAFDWFKGFREGSFVYGDETLSGHIGICPLSEEGHQHISAGFVFTGIVDDEEVDENTHVEDWLVGGYFEMPILDVNQMSTLPFPVDAEIFVGIKVQKYIGGNSDFPVTLYTGFETNITGDGNVVFRTEGQFNKQDSILPDWFLGIGVAIHHW